MASGNDELAQLVTMSEDALDTDDEAVDPSFDFDSSMKSDADHLQESFCEEWISHFEREDRVSLALFLRFQLSKHFNLGKTKAAELAGEMVGQSLYENGKRNSWKKVKCKKVSKASTRELVCFGLKKLLTGKLPDTFVRMPV